ncbi:unnamed protein product [Rotaria sordida]|uniref:Uncharacterized protein n=1 Tax=Rotaria sordida TaxID=392033 RepID=A0A819UD65_9BILA|nr:unnamed protein product [Rotaria sordida]CAF4093276.1 unnamed protein product [Rotaria sordida]
MIPRIYDMDQLDTIYILSDSESQQEQLFTEYPKVKSKYTEIASICEAIRQAVKRCDQNFIPISFIPAGDETSNANLDQLHSSFMYTQIFKEILLDTEYNQQSIKDLVLYWRSQYVGNSEQLNNIDEFGSSYRSDLSISWYTRHWFTYSMLNRALRTLEADIIIKIGFFICDLHRQLVELHAQQFNSDNTTLFTVYRGQGLSKADFEKLVKTKGGLISFNSFLSTSKNRQEAIHIVKTCLKRDHPDLADLYDNIGVMYHDMKEYKKALRFCKKSLRLRQQTLPETHPTLVNSYNNISQIYLQMEEYSTALSYAKRAFQIVQKSLSSNHPNFQATQDNLIGIIGIIGIIRMITGITFDK